MISGALYKEYKAHPHLLTITKLPSTFYTMIEDAEDYRKDLSFPDLRSLAVNKHEKQSNIKITDLTKFPSF